MFAVLVENCKVSCPAEFPNGDLEKGHDASAFSTAEIAVQNDIGFLIKLDFRNSISS